MPWVRRQVWRQAQSFEASSVFLHPQGMIDDWMKGVVEGHVGDLLVHDVLREQLSLLAL